MKTGARLSEWGALGYSLRMTEGLMLLLLLGVSGLLLRPPRGESTRWLATVLLIWWGSLVVVGLRRGLAPGLLPWLLLLALIGALVALVVIWSLVYMSYLPREEEQDE